MADELTTVTLVGTYRGKPASAMYRRNGDSWLLTLNTNGQSRRIKLDRREKPCWTIARKYFEEMNPPKRRAAKKPEPKPDGWLEGMTILFPGR